MTNSSHSSSKSYDRSCVEPHSEEAVQNLHFLDEQPGVVNEIDQGYDSLAETAMISDTTLDDFFSRPIKISSTLWASDFGVTDILDPWSAYFENKRVINRLANYKLLRADLHVKFVINGTPFCFGRACAAYNPLPLWDKSYIPAAAGELGLCQATQKPKIFINPTTSEGGELVLPFFWYKDALDIVNQEWRMMGYIELFSLNNLKTSNGKSETLEISVFAWATNVKVAVPTSFNPAAIVPQAKDEYTDSKGPISKPAGIIANIAAKLKNVPLIGPYARSTEIGARAVSALASVFGYSKPALLESSVYRPTLKASIATVNAPDDLIKLSVDCKQELTIDPRTTGLGGEDELTITSIASRESWIDTYVFPLAKPSESLLWSILVDPGVYRVDNGGIMQTACSFATQPFKFWRGSLIYRIQVVASQYHRGRLKFVYDPEGTDPSGETEYNTAYTTIVDITESSDFEITIGWGQAAKYREHIPWGSLESEFLGVNTPLFYQSSLDPWGNGTLSCYVVNELSSPDDTVDNDIEINVFIKAGEDFEVAMPTGESVSRMRISTAVNPSDSDSKVPVTDEAIPPAEAALNVKSRVRPNITDILPQAADVAGAMVREQPVIDLPDSATPAVTMAATGSVTDATNHVFFGESIRSFRQMLKRYNRHENVVVSTGIESTSFIRIQRSAWPSWPGFLKPTANSAPPTYVLGGGSYYYGNTTLLNYVPSAFAGYRGSTRVIADFSGYPCCSQRSGLTATRYTSCQPQNYVDTLGNDNTPQAKKDALINNDDFTGQEGAMIQSQGVNPTLSFEVPYYSNYRFTPTRQPQGFGAEGKFNTPCFKVGGNFFDNSDDDSFKFKSIDLWYAAGEDFTCFFYVGPPIVYIESIPPT